MYLAFLDWAAVEDLIERYGYLAVALGTVFDHSGLTLFVVAGGAAASATDKFHLLGVILAGACGSVVSDMLWFGIGRWRAGWLERIVRSERGRARLEVMGQGMRRYALPVLMFGRFLPWLGRFVPAAAGLRRVSSGRAFIYCALGGLFGGALYGCIGYFAAEWVKGIEGWGIWVAAGALVLSIPVAGYALKYFDRKVNAYLAQSHVNEQAQDKAKKP